MASNNDIITSDSGSGSVQHDDLANPASDSSRKSKNSQGPNINGNSVAVDDVPSDIEMAAMGKNPDEGKSRWQRAKEKRWFTNGVPAIPCGIFTFCLTTLCLCGIAIPTLLLGMGPPLCQDAVDATFIYTYNNRITQWSYTNQNGSDCAEYLPSTLTIVQDLYFTGIPWYATMGPLYVQPANLTLAYNGSAFGQLFVPEIDLTNTDDGNKWANNTVTTLVITNMTAFIKGNTDLLPLSGATQGWTIWHQSGPVIMKEDVIGVTMYYHAVMSQDMNISDVQFLDGPMQPSLLSDNLINTLACTADYL